MTEMSYAVLPDRMPPIPQDRMTDAQKQAVAELVAGPRGSLRGPFNALLRSPELMRRVQKVGEYLRFQGVLDMRINVARTAIPDGKPLPLAPLPLQVRPRV